MNKFKEELIWEKEELIWEKGKDDSHYSLIIKFIGRKFLYQVSEEYIWLYELIDEHDLYIWHWDKWNQMPVCRFERAFKLFIKIDEFLNNNSFSGTNNIEKIKIDILRQLRGLTKEEFKLLKKLERENQ